jgi:hypothetical protein
MARMGGEAAYEASEVSGDNRDDQSSILGQPAKYINLVYTWSNVTRNERMDTSGHWHSSL